MFLLNSTWDPAREMRRLQDEIDHLFAGVSGAVHTFPAVNVWTRENGALISAELPGVDPAAVEVSVLNDTLTLRGERKAPVPGEKEELLRSERGSGTFARDIRLPFRIDPESVSAAARNGVLTVTVARAASDLPRKIAVQGE